MPLHEGRLGEGPDAMSRAIHGKRWILTTCIQGGGAPIFDPAMVTDRGGGKWWGVAIYLAFWRRRKTRPPGLALVVARKRPLS